MLTLPKYQSNPSAELSSCSTSMKRALICTWGGVMFNTWMAFSMMSKSCGVAWTNRHPQPVVEENVLRRVQIHPQRREETFGRNAGALREIGCGHKCQSAATAAAATTATTAATATATGLMNEPNRLPGEALTTGTAAPVSCPLPLPPLLPPPPLLPLPLLLVA